MKTTIYFAIMTLIVSSLVIGDSYAKTKKITRSKAKQKFVLGEISGNGGVQSCSYYLSSEKRVSFNKKLQGMRIYLEKKDEECFINIVNYLKYIDPQTTQVRLNNLMFEYENYQEEKQLIVRAISKFADLNVLPILVENMLALYDKGQKFQKKEVPLSDYTLPLYVEKIEEFYKLRLEIARTAALLTEKNPKFMKDYSNEIRAGYEHPIYKDIDEKTVGDSEKYNKDIEMFLGETLKILDGNLE